MSKILCYTIGRDQSASVVLSHDTVSRVHAELIPVADGQVYVTDCASTGGTYIDEDGRWQKITQAFVNAGGRVRFGELEVGVEQLLADIARLSAGSGGVVPPTVAPPHPPPKRANPWTPARESCATRKTGEPIALDSD